MQRGVDRGSDRITASPRSQRTVSLNLPAAATGGMVPFWARNQPEKEVTPLLGYMGKLLRADLTSGTLYDEPLDLDTAAAFVGGSGYATRIINDEVPGDTDPLGPGNKLIFMTGPTTATSLPTTARYEVCTKSPLTNMWLDASSSGWWARDFKMAGYDGLIVEGRADAPVYLWIKDGKAEIRDASAFWGLDSDQTQEAIRAELGDAKIKVACIGQAGENLSYMAGVCNEYGRLAGRSGLGAVMGSKKLKAVVVLASRKMLAGDDGDVRNLVRTSIDEFGPAATFFRELAQRPTFACRGSYPGRRRRHPVVLA